ncbi:MAG TPA: CGNR zinc finger domain-containing protein [Gemmatimonadales bacterium]|nr:CGNR zinc finger domain-containing protein [Gemmatimonadales bacterium]
MANDGFTLLGDALWLDFINSARGRTAFSPDLLPDSTAFARWCELQHLEPPAEGASFALIVEFRDRLTELAQAMHDGGRTPAGAIASLNELLARSAGTHQLTRVGGEWRLRFAPTRPPGALEAIARSAAATLAETRTAVRRCAGESCSLFIADPSPTGSRRWCDPTLCGGTAVVERRRGNRR